MSHKNFKYQDSHVHGNNHFSTQLIGGKNSSPFINFLNDLYFKKIMKKHALIEVLRYTNIHIYVYIHTLVYIYIYVSCKTSIGRRSAFQIGRAWV